MGAQGKQSFYKVCLKGERTEEGYYSYVLPGIVEVTDDDVENEEKVSYESFPVMAVMTKYGLRDNFFDLAISGPEERQKGLCYDHLVEMDDFEVELLLTLIDGKTPEEREANMKRYETALRSKMIIPERGAKRRGKKGK
jgi:hypothetical protein